MSNPRRLLLRLYAFFRPQEAERELRREVEAHLRLLQDDLERRGVPPDRARLEARRALGGVELTKELARDERSFLWLEDLRRDLQHAARALGSAPGFATVAILTLALGIAGTTSIFTIVHGVILDPLPFQDPDELVAVHHTMPGVGSDETPLSRAMYLTFRDHSRTLEEIGLWKGASLTVTGAGEAERVEAMQITEGLLPLLGVGPVLGRGYSAEDVAPGGEYPVILAWGYWQRRFGGDPDVLNRSLVINGHESPIVGVLPERFALYDSTPELYIPLAIDPARIRVGGWSYPAIARLAPDVDPEEATRDLDRLTVLATEEYPGIPLAELEARSFGTFVRPLKDDLVGETSTVLWILLGTVGVVLLIACINVANLFLVRAEALQRDIALRTAMGASKGRLARQFLTESLVVGTLGGALGLSLAFAGVRIFVRLAPESLPRLENVAVDPPVILFTLGVSLLSGLLLGTIPMMGLGRRRGFWESLKEGGGGTGGRKGARLRHLLATSQVAMALVLLVASGLMVRTLQALRGVPPGFQDPQEVLTFRIAVPSAEAPSGEQAARLHHRILERIGGLPGVDSVSAATSVAMDSWDSWDDVFVQDFPELDEDSRPFRRFNWIAPGYFGTLRNPLLAGRDVEWADLYERRPVAVVTENFAREFWQEPERAVGRRIRNHEDYPWSEIVGVVGNVYTKGVAEEPPSVIYLPFFMGQFWERDFVWRGLRYAVRTSREDPNSLLPEIREVVSAENRNLPIFRVQTLDQILAHSLRGTSFTLVMLTISAGVALFLGIVGVYGVISYVVARRTREIGVRLALGARPSDMRLMVVLRGGTLGLTGILVGWVTAAGLSRFLSTLLFEVSPVDPATYGVLAALLIGVVLMASYLPARRAAAVDPTTALRWE